MLLLSLNYIGIVTASLGLLLFLPQIIKQLGVTNMQVGWVTMIPYIFGAISMLVCGWISDRVGDRRWSLFVDLRDLDSRAGVRRDDGRELVVACRHHRRRDRLLRHQGAVLVDADDVLTGPAAAAGIAWINSLGNLGGFFGPTIVGWAKQLTGSFAGGLYALALCALISAVVSLFGLNIREQRQGTGARDDPRRVAAAEERPEISGRDASRCCGQDPRRSPGGAWADAHRLGMAGSWSGNEART